MALATQYTYMKVQIGTVDFTGYLANTEQIASLPVGAEVGRATLSFRNDGSMPTIPKWGTVVINAGTAAPGTPVWGGYATRQSSDPVSMHGGTVRMVTVDCQSYAIALITTEPISETYGGGDHDALVLDYAIVTNLLQTYLAPFYDAGSISSVNPVQCDYIQFSEETLRSALNKIGERSGKEYGIAADAKFFYRPTGSAGTLAHALTDSPDMTDNFPMQVKPYYDQDDVDLRNAVRVLGGWSLSAVQTEDFTTDGFVYQFQVAYFPQDIIRVTLANIVQSVGVYLVDDPADFDVLVWYDQRKFIYQLPPAAAKTFEVVYRYPVRVEEDVFDAASIAEVGGTIWAATIEDSSISDAAVAQLTGSAYLARSTSSIARGQLTTTWVGTAVRYLPGQIIPITTQAFHWDREPMEIQAVTMRFAPRPGGTGSCLTYWDIDLGTPETIGRSIGESFSDAPAVHVEAVVPNIRSITAADVPTLDHGSDLSGLGDDDHTIYLLATGTRTGASSQAQTFTNGIVGPTWKPAADSTTALQMQTSGGTALLTADTTNKKVTVTTVDTSANLGSEKVINGDFATSGTWTFGTGWAHDGATFTAKHTAGNTAALEQTISITSGKTYLIMFQIKTRTAGSVKVYLGGTWNAVSYDSTDDFGPVITAGGSGKITFTPSSDFDGSIDNVSVRELTELLPMLNLASSGGLAAPFRLSPYGLGVGLDALKWLGKDSAGGNIAIGDYAGASMTTAYRSVAIGASALNLTSTGVYNVAIGNGALASNEVGSNSIAIGSAALNQAKRSWNNVAIGASALSKLDGRNADGNEGNNVAIGTGALTNQTTGYSNVAIGPYYELGVLTTGSNNLSIGSGNSVLTTGAYNILIGSSAGYAISTGQSNLLIGAYAAFGTNGNGTISLGAFSGGRTSGDKNTFVGYQSGYGSWTVTSQDRSTMVGAETGLTGTSSDAVFLGYRAGYYETGNSKLFIDNQSRSNEANSRIASLVYGEFNATVASQLLRVNGVFQQLITDTGTNNVLSGILISRNSTGTPDALFGSGIAFNLKSSTTADQAAATLNTLWADATHATRSAAVTLNTVYQGSLANVAKFGGTLGNVFNEDGNAWCDFRVEGDTATHLLFVDASADAIGIGTSSPSVRLHLAQASGDTNAVRNLFRVTHNSSGTAAAGFGASILFGLEDDTSDDQDAASIVGKWASATHASRKGQLELSAYDATAARLGLAIGTNGSAALLGFFGATAVAKPTGVAVSAAGIHAALVSLGLIAA